MFLAVAIFLVRNGRLQEIDVWLVAGVRLARDMRCVFDSCDNRARSRRLDASSFAAPLFPRLACVERITLPFVGTSATPGSASALLVRAIHGG